MATVTTNPHVLSHKTRLAAVETTSSLPTTHEDALSGLMADLGHMQLFQVLIQMLPHAAVFVVDAERLLLCWNDNAEEMLGFKREEVLGRYCLTANQCHQCMLGCGISEYGAVNDVPLLLLNKDGEQVRVRKTARAFFDKQQRFMGGVEILVRDEPTPLKSSAIGALTSGATMALGDHATASSQEWPSTGGAAGRWTSRQAGEIEPVSDQVLRKLPSPRTLSATELSAKVREALVRTDGHIGRAASLLGVSRPTLWRWRRKLNIDV